MTLTDARIAADREVSPDRPSSRRRRAFALLALTALALGCGRADGGTGTSTDDVTSVPTTGVQEQSIGNCWAYASTALAESLHKGATGEDTNLSESWTMYWFWLGLVSSGAGTPPLHEGGAYDYAASLMYEYGVALEEDFDGGEDAAVRQQVAIDALNASLTAGPLKDAVARRDRRAIVAELDRAFQLSADVVAQLDRVFGADRSRTFEDRAAVAASVGTLAIAPQNFAVRLKRPGEEGFVLASLADAVGGRPGWFSKGRKGKWAFSEERYPSSAAERRSFWKRVQRALHDEMPVIVTWDLDMNARTPSDTFSLAQLEKRGPGEQGIHITLITDYQAEVPGVGTLEAGKPATPEQMQAALSDDTTIAFVRVKNSWGSARPKGFEGSTPAGYLDLETGYLDGPIAWCDDGGEGAARDCSGTTVPLAQVVLPHGY